MIQLNRRQKEAARSRHLSSTHGKTCCYHRDTFLQPPSSSCHTFSESLCNSVFLSGLNLNPVYNDTPTNWTLSWDHLAKPCVMDQLSLKTSSAYTDQTCDISVQRYHCDRITTVQSLNAPPGSDSHLYECMLQ